MLDLSFLDSNSLKLLYILAVSISVWLILQLLTNTIVKSMSSGTPRGRRLRTLSSVIKTVISTLIIVFVVFESLSIVGVNVAPLIASAGVAGLAIGFGAQTLVKDVISGFFLLAEDQFDEGDEVEISGKKGVVKKISLRTIWLEDKDGTLHIVPAGSITVVTNFTKVKVPNDGITKETKEKKLDKPNASK